MQAAFITRTGPPDVIQIGDLPKPTVGPQTVLIEAKYAAVNPIDCYLRSGLVPNPSAMPYVIGCDVAGVVHEVGRDVVEFKPGDRVWCTNQGLLGRQGTFSGYCAVDKEWAFPTPANVTDQQAAACALVGVTAHLGLFERGKLCSGETVMVRGGSGGVGSMVIQMARAAGARVVASAGSPEKVQYCRDLGAEHVFDYRSTETAAEIRGFAPNGVNLFWDTTRSPDFDTAVASLAEYGRMILMAGREARPQFPVGPFYVKQCSLLGLVMFKATSAQMLAAATDMNRWMAEGKLAARIRAEFPLNDAAQAHTLQESSTLRLDGQLAGKILVKIV